MFLIGGVCALLFKTAAAEMRGGDEKGGAGALSLSKGRPASPDQKHLLYLSLKCENYLVTGGRIPLSAYRAK
jgi:hypothetical protein